MSTYEERNDQKARDAATLEYRANLATWVITVNSLEASVGVAARRGQVGEALVDQVSTSMACLGEQIEVIKAFQDTTSESDAVQTRQILSGYFEIRVRLRTLAAGIGIAGYE